MTTRAVHRSAAPSGLWRFSMRLVCLWLVAGFVAPSMARAGEAPTADAAVLPARPGPGAAPPMTFASPEQAAAALAAAWHDGGTGDLLTIFGAEGEALVNSGDPVAERNARDRLAAAYDHRHRIDGAGDEARTLVIGEEDWPYPIPLVAQDGGWRFDARQGEEQILDRRIGRNELHAIAVCRVYVEAQRDYATRSRPDGGAPEYARKVTSSAGAHDGLYWPVTGGSVAEEQSPLGPLAAAAEAEGYGAAAAAGKAPFEGYYYRILTRQGPHAHGGARDYLDKGRMTGGFALVAFPAQYGNSGVMTFIVNQNGIVYEKDLGADTATAARHLAAYDPDPTWRIVDP